MSEINARLATPAGFAEIVGDDFPILDPVPDTRTHYDPGGLELRIRLRTIANTAPAIIIVPATTITIEAIGFAITAAQPVFLIGSRCAATVFVGLGLGLG
jgi:hypothetical protein